MNINLVAAASSKKKEPAKLVNPNNNVFGDDDEDECDEPSSRAGVNQAVRSEQDALKLRAQKAMQMAEASVYDFDGVYDSFHKEPEQEKVEEDDLKSRYIVDLLEAAKKRKHEKDIIYEKKIAREQAMEEAEEDYRGKEKFVTAAYRKKLEERGLWLAQDERQRKEDEENDVTKKTGGLGMATFYGNLSYNVALGGNVETKGGKSATPTEDETKGGTRDKKSRGSQSQAKVSSNLADDIDGSTERFAEGFIEHANKVSNDKENKKGSVHEVREQKVKEALERYRVRKGLLA